MNSALFFRSVFIASISRPTGWNPAARLVLRVLAAVTLFTGAANADTVRVAVAANFSAPVQSLAADFERRTGHMLAVSVGSTGKFYAQIMNGAPFDVLLSADQTTPARLVDDGRAVADSRFTYAVGRLVLWSTQPNLVDAEGAVLQGGAFRKIALASPALAPYGAAALETLQRLALAHTLRPKFVQAESVGQAFAFVATGNAELGFVALSQVLVPDGSGRLREGSMWRVPAELHAPIRQDAVLLDRARSNDAAIAFIAYLSSDAAGVLIRDFGYGTEPTGPQR